MTAQGNFIVYTGLVCSTDLYYNMPSRDGPKFGERRSSAEQFGSVRLGNM